MPAPSSSLPEQGPSERTTKNEFAEYLDPDGVDSSERKKRRKSGKERKRKHKKEDAKRLQEGESTSLMPDRSNLKTLDDESTWRLFYSDRRGDMLNIQFGGLHVGDVPKYHLVDGISFSHFFGTCSLQSRWKKCLRPFPCLGSTKK